MKILSKKAEKPVEVAEVEAPKAESKAVKDVTCACGEPVAKGQTWVCINHQRSS